MWPKEKISSSGCLTDVPQAANMRDTYEHCGLQSDEIVATYAALHIAKRHFLLRTTEEATCINQDGNCLPLASYRQILRGIA